MKSNKIITKTNPLALALILGAISFIINIQGINAPFVTTGEPREALVAQSMYLDHDLLESIRYDEEFATKPPLLHWAMVLVANIQGDMNEFASRLPSVLSSTLAIIVWSLFILPILGKQRTILSIAILLVSAEWYRHSSIARVDMLLACFVIIALGALYKAFSEKKEFYSIPATIALALACLTKGPVGAVLPLTITILALLSWKEFTFRKFFKISVIGALAIMPLIAWYIAEYSLSDGSIVSIVLNENLDRLVGNMEEKIDPHTHGPLYLFGAFFLGLSPWSIIALFCIPYFWKNRKTVKISQSSDEKRLHVWCLITIVTFFAIFLLPSSKRGVYLLPAYPAAATLLAIILFHFYKNNKQAAEKILVSLASIIATLWTLTLVLRLKFINIYLLPIKQKELDKIAFFLDIFAISPDTISIALWLLPLIAIGAIVFLYRERLSMPFTRISILMAFIFLVVKINFIVPAAHVLSSKSFIERELTDHNPTDISLRTIRMYSEVFYIRQLRPELEVKDYDKNSRFVFLWKQDEHLIKDPLYLHTSEQYVKKPGRYLDFAILDITNLENTASGRFH